MSLRPRASTLGGIFFLWVTIDSSLGFAGSWLRGHRLIGFEAKKDDPPNVYEIALFSKAPSWWLPQEGETGPFDPFAEAELKHLETEKFKRFEEAKYLQGERDLEIINSVLTHEPLIEHDDVVAIYKWDFQGAGLPRRPEDFPPRKMVGLLGVKRGRLLVENRLNFTLDSEKPQALTSNERFPLHWRWGKYIHKSTIAPQYPYYRSILDGLHRQMPPESIRWYVGGKPLQLSSTYVDAKERKPWLAYMMAIAYWHGLLTEGIVLPPGRPGIEVGGVKMEGSAIVAPSVVVAETLDEGHRRTLRSYKSSPVPVHGALLFPDPFSSRHTTSVESFGLPELRTELSQHWVDLLSRFRDQDLCPGAVLPINLKTIRGFQPDPRLKEPPLMVFQPVGTDMVFWKGGCRWALEQMGLLHLQANPFLENDPEAAALHLGKSMCQYNAFIGAPTVSGPLLDRFRGHPIKPASGLAE